MTSNAKTPQKADLGINIMIAGMSFQVFSLLLFMGLWAEFALRLRAGVATRGTDGDAELEFGKLRSSFGFKAFQIGMCIVQQNSLYSVCIN
jgi:RTA1 like protein